LRQIPQQLLEKRAEIALHRDEVVGFHRDFGQLVIGRRKIRLAADDLIDLENGAPATMHRSVPSGTFSIFWIVPIVPMRRRSSGPGSSMSLSLRTTRPICLPSRSASSTRAMPGRLITASGITVFGKSTASCNAECRGRRGLRFYGVPSGQGPFNGHAISVRTTGKRS